jgi:HAD superfamily hydrolase (TIGR01509 family)
MRDERLLRPGHRKDMKKKPEALIFDFDGVLADTEPLYWRAWAALLARHNVAFSWEEYCRVGRGIPDELMLQCIPQLAASPSLLAKVQLEMPARREMVERFSREESPIGAATIQLLHELREFRLGLVTSSSRADVEPLLKSARIADCFSATVFAEDSVHHKPHPAPYLLMRERLGLRSGVVFEDSDAGMRSATEAGFEALRVPVPQSLPEIVRKRLGCDDGVSA